MTENIRKYLIYSAFAYLLPLFIGCSRVKTNYFFYGYYSDEEGLPESYILKQVIYGESRKEVDYWFTPEGEIENKVIAYYKVFDGKLEKLVMEQGQQKRYEPYLNYNDTNCIDFIYHSDNLNSFASTSICFKKQEDIIVNNNLYSKAFKFIKTKGNINKVTTNLYLDKNLVLIKEEYLEGERPYYKIEKDTSSLANEFIRIVNKYSS